MNDSKADIINGGLHKSFMDAGLSFSPAKISYAKDTPLHVQQQKLDEAADRRAKRNAKRLAQQERSNAGRIKA